MLHTLITLNILWFNDYIYFALISSFCASFMLSFCFMFSFQLNFKMNSLRIIVQCEYYFIELKVEWKVLLLRYFLCSFYFRWIMKLNCHWISMIMIYLKSEISPHQNMCSLCIAARESAVILTYVHKRSIALWKDRYVIKKEIQFHSIAIGWLVSRLVDCVDCVPQASQRAHSLQSLNLFIIIFPIWISVINMNECYNDEYNTTNNILHSFTSINSRAFIIHTYIYTYARYIQH